MQNERGQVVLILVLVMTVALAIGISVVQRSLSDISTATKVEQSSRAFSAAEAGIERSLQTGGNIGITPQENNSQYQATNIGLIPAAATSGNQQDPLECPPGNPSLLAKEEVAQIWLANPATAIESYKPLAHQLDVYWGNSATDRAALELTLISYDGTQYKARKWYLDQIATRTNNFDVVPTCDGNKKPSATSGTYQCYIRLGDGSVNAVKNASLPTGLMLLRARLLYNTTSQPFAVQAVGTCGADCSIPSQTKFITSIGTSGQTQRKVQVCETQKVVPPYFDYAIFSAGEISK